MIKICGNYLALADNYINSIIIIIIIWINILSILHVNNSQLKSKIQKYKNNSYDLKLKKDIYILYKWNNIIIWIQKEVILYNQYNQYNH